MSSTHPHLTTRDKKQGKTNNIRNMKKLYTIMAAMFLCAANLSAQENGYVQFVEKNAAGEYVALADGATVTRTTLVEDEMGMGEDFISSGLFVKNISGDAVQTYLDINIETMPFGAHKICYGSCMQQDATGTYTYPADLLSSKGNIMNVTGLAKDDVKSLEAEWICGAKEGKTIIKYTVHACQKDGTETVIIAGRPTPKPIYKVVESKTVTVNYLYDPTGAGIDGVKADKAVRTEYLDITGKRIQEPANGLYIKKSTMSDGTVITRKIAR